MCGVWEEFLRCGWKWHPEERESSMLNSYILGSVYGGHELYGWLILYTFCTIGG